jgi:D-alanyl-D-alanine carboxypeptidase (penicillin-binding protein 5/6)
MNLLIRVCAAILAILMIGVGLVVTRAEQHQVNAADGRHVAWPATGQAAADVAGLGLIGTSGGDRPVPIASVAKVMTAYLVLRHRPIDQTEPGFVFTITQDEEIDTARRRDRHESVVAVLAGERITEHDALLALLLPSANNMAVALARRISGSRDRFVAEMNAQARRLGMRHTTYTDPSGYASSTVSTAPDQLLLAKAAMRIPAFAYFVRQRSATIPVAGLITNTDDLLGHHGFVGLKTGSHHAAGGCFMFESVQWVHGRRLVIVGVVLGQRGHSLVDAGLSAADRLVVSISARFSARS